MAAFTVFLVTLIAMSISVVSFAATNLFTNPDDKVNRNFSRKKAVACIIKYADYPGNKKYTNYGAPSLRGEGHHKN